MTATAVLLPPYFRTEIGCRVTFWLLLLTIVAVVLISDWRTFNRELALPQPSLPDSQLDERS